MRARVAAPLPSTTQPPPQLGPSLAWHRQGCNGGGRIRVGPGHCSHRDEPVAGVILDCWRLNSANLPLDPHQTPCVMVHFTLHMHLTSQPRWCRSRRLSFMADTDNSDQPSSMGSSGGLNSVGASTTDTGIVHHSLSAPSDLSPSTFVASSMAGEL